MSCRRARRPGSILRRRDDPFYAALGRRCLHICSDRDLEIRDGLGLDYVDDAEEAEFILNTGPAGWDDTIEDYAPLLRRALASRLPMVCANPDLLVMHGARLALCAGALAQWYEQEGGRVRWHGKPYRSVYDSCLALLGIADRSRILAVGDSLRTDIAGAAGAGLDSVLIAGGIHAEEFGMAGEGEPDPARIAALWPPARRQLRSPSPAASAGEQLGRRKPAAGPPGSAVIRDRLRCQDRAAEPGFVIEPDRGHDDSRRRRPDHPLALERGPDRRVAQSGGVARGDDRLAQMKMIAVRVGQAGQDDAACFFAGAGIVGQPRQLLQQGQGLQLQRIEVERVSFRHRL